MGNGSKDSVTRTILKYDLEVLLLSFLDQDYKRQTGNYNKDYKDYKNTSIVNLQIFQFSQKKKETLKEVTKTLVFQEKGGLV